MCAVAGQAREAIHMSPLSNRLLNFALLIVSIGSCFLVGEFGLRALGYHGGVSFKIEDTILVDDPILNWRHKPNSEFYFGAIVYRFNEKGFRDYDYPSNKNKQTVRIFLASDSVGFGTNVRLKDAYPKLLESEANALGTPVRTEVVSYSMPGLSLKQKLHLVERYAPDYDPDLIVIDYVINDVEFESVKMGRGFDLQACAINLLHLPFPCVWKERLKESAFLFVFQQAIENSLHQVKWEDRNQFYDQVEGDYYHRLYAMKDKQLYLDDWFRRIGEYQKTTGIPVLVPIFPLIYDYDKYKWEDINRLIIQLCEKNGLRYVSLLDSFKRYPWNELRVQRGDFTHPSVKGNTVAAEAILSALRTHNMLVQRAISSPLRGAL